ncbi:hypothetical protein ACFSUD_18055 [Sulfitobacter aestuarii]|uniref:Sodium/calcium exchanger membrane region domain-containing protein n=1 Tax=Sulfitobacter aestuarii TaxID=2161676 RepID=A0ABW5U6N3_9RHOB
MRASSFSIFETVIGLTPVAVGASLPELVTSILAAIRKHTDAVFGDIVGTDICDVVSPLGDCFINLLSFVRHLVMRIAQGHFCNRRSTLDRQISNGERNE